MCLPICGSFRLTTLFYIQKMEIHSGKRYKITQPIQVPNNLTSNDARETTSESLERLIKIDKIFQSIPVFSNDGEISIRAFLHSLVSTCNYSTVLLSPKEYVRLVWSKLSSELHFELQAENFTTAEQLHTVLLDTFDIMSERDSDAWSLLQSLEPSATLDCIDSFLKEANRVRELCSGTMEMKSRLFVISLKKFLPTRLKLMINDKQLEQPGEVLDWDCLTNFARVHRGEIDDHLLLIGQPGSPSTDSVAVGSAGTRRSPTEVRCSYCRKLGHSRSTCFKLMNCEICNRLGHPTKHCRKK